MSKPCVYRKGQPGEFHDDGDEVIADVRAARHRISERFAHDPYKLVEYYMELQKSHPNRFVRAPDGEQDRSAA
jgi:hypothetical protein